MSPGDRAGFEALVLYLLTGCAGKGKEVRASSSSETHPLCPPLRGRLQFARDRTLSRAAGRTCPPAESSD